VITKKPSRKKKSVSPQTPLFAKPKPRKGEKKQGERRTKEGSKRKEKTGEKTMCTRELRLPSSQVLQVLAKERGRADGQSTVDQV